MKNNKKIRKIVFFNTVSEVDEYTGKEPDTLFIAMKPSVYSYLRKKGINAEDTLAYFTVDSHAAALEKSDVIMGWIRKEFDTLNLGFDSPWAHRESFVFWVRCPILYFLWAIEVVLNAVKMHNPEIITASLSGKRFVSSLFIEPEEKFLGVIVKDIARQYGIRYEDIAQTVVPGFKSFSDKIKNYLYLPGKFALKYKAFQLWKALLWVRRSISKKAFVLFTTKRYQMDKLAEEVKKDISGQKVCFLKGPAISYSRMPAFFIALLQAKCFKAILQKRDMFENFADTVGREKETFSFRGISFSEALAEKITDNYAGHMAGFYLWAIELDSFLNLLKPLTVISSGSRSDDLVMGELCDKKGIFAVMIPHGSNIAPKNHHESIEWGENGMPILRGPFSFVALQTPLTEGYIEQFPITGKVIKTGPLIWGRNIDRNRGRDLARKIFNGKDDLKKNKIVLHAGTPKASNALRLYVYETSDEYIKSISDLANAIEEMPDTFLIVKFRPFHEIGIEDLKKRIAFSDKVILCVDESFTDLLGISDLVVSFSSTAIEEALQNRVPVLLYGGRGRYQHLPAYEIKNNGSVDRSALYFIREERNLSYGIDKILNLEIDINENKKLFTKYIYDIDAIIPFKDFLDKLAEETAGMRQ